MTKICVKPSRNQDPRDAQQSNFMKVEAIFYRLQKYSWSMLGCL